MMSLYTHREVIPADLPLICGFPRNEIELYHMFPKAIFPLTVDQLQEAIDNRFDSTVVLSSGTISAFANFYEVVEKHHCSIGNVVVNPLFRGKGAGTFLIKTMEAKALEKHNAREVHISCFNQNISGLLLYHKLGYIPFDIERRIDGQSLPVVLIKMKKSLRGSTSNYM